MATAALTGALRQTRQLFAVLVSLLCLFSASPATHDSEYSRLLALQAAWSDVESLHIHESSIHGRGVFVAEGKSLVKGASLGLTWFDFYKTEEQCARLPSALQAKQGYLSDGGTIEYRTMPVEAAKAECSSRQDCVGITYQVNTAQCGSGGDFQSCKEDVQEIEFKNHSSFSEDARWRTFVKAHRDVSFYPVSCHTSTYPEGAERNHLTAEQALVCWPRWVNHACNASATISFHDLPGDDSIPDIPWVKCPRKVTVETLRDLASGEEITLNYELFPMYMSRNVPGGVRC